MKLRFKKENVKLAKPGLRRIGFAEVKVGKAKVEVLKHNDNGKVSYDVCVSRGNGWTWFYEVPNLNQVKKIIFHTEQIPIMNAF